MDVFSRLEKIVIAAGIAIIGFENTAVPVNVKVVNDFPGCSPQLFYLFLRNGAF
jgi:hypothetical protein